MTDASNPAPDLGERIASALLLALARPVDRILRVRSVGLGRIPADRPLMFVGNHQLLAADVPSLLSLLRRDADIRLRPLADDVFFRFPPIAAIVRAIGAERADPAVCRRLLSEGACVLVYPGGAREAAKGEGAAYALEWWDRLGFARVALESRCPVIPVASAGLDDSVRVLLSRDDYLASPARRLIDGLHLRHDLLPPLFYPRARPHLDFHFGQPIRPDAYLAHDPETAARILRSDVAAAIEAGLRTLLDT